MNLSAKWICPPEAIPLPALLDDGSTANLRYITGPVLVSQRLEPLPYKWKTGVPFLTGATFQVKVSAPSTTPCEQGYDL